MTSVSDALELLVPPFEDGAAWDDVLRRAGPERRRPRIGVLALAATLALVAGLAATPFGRAVVADTIERFSAWVSGEPGEPASPEQQAAFERRNASSYASFPTTPRLRLLLTAEAAGRTFELLGFRTESSLCLRLVRSWSPGVGRSLECVPASFLAQIEEPAQVVALAWMQVGEPAQTVDGVYGFAADDVEAIELERQRSGRTRASVANNVFLALRARGAGSVADHPLPDPVIRVWALTRDGGRVLLPFVSDNMAAFGPDGPTGPSYAGHETVDPADLPGPSEVERRPAAGRVGWVERREPRGEPIDLGERIPHLGRLLFARVIQPDPNDPFRAAVSIIDVTRGPPRSHKGPQLCLHELRPLSRPPYGAACTALRPDHWRGQLLGLAYGGTPWTRISTIAGDETARVEVFLASGRRFAVPLRDNVLSIQLPFAEFPAKLVAYDSAGRVIEIFPLHGPAKLLPCPEPAFGAAGPARAYERVDLGARTVNGHQILGRTLPEVVGALGEPAIIGRGPHRGGRPTRTVRYGSAGLDYALEISFGPRGGRIVAIALTFRSSRVVDARLGPILRIPPHQLELAVARTYGDVYSVRSSYGSIPGHACEAVLAAVGVRRQLVFGLDPQGKRKPYLRLTWQ
jgi:hypothetical protein